MVGYVPVVDFIPSMFVAKIQVSDSHGCSPEACYTTRTLMAYRRSSRFDESESNPSERFQHRLLNYSGELFSPRNSETENALILQASQIQQWQPQLGHPAVSKT